MPTDFALTIISSAAVSAALSGILLWVTKTWIGERLKGSIKAEYDTKLESHKAQLKAETDIEVERLKSSLSIVSAQRNTTFTHLHTRRVDVIANTYSKLKKLHDAVSNYVKGFSPTGDKPKEDRLRDVIAAHEEFTPYFSQNQIFLTKGVTSSLEMMSQELVHITSKFIIEIDLSNTPDAQAWNEITAKFNGNLKEALDGLEDELRSLLGDDKA